jgi:cell wall-associated NlpC family hydrolase
MDCSGLVMTVFKEALGIQLPHNSEQLFQLGKQITIRQWKVGDLVFFRTGRTRKISHVGIYLFASKFVHSSTSRGVVISDFIQEDYYQKRYAGARRIISFQ